MLGGRTAREMLLVFYVKHGLEDDDAQVPIAAQSSKVRTVIVAAGAMLIKNTTPHEFPQFLLASQEKVLKICGIIYVPMLRSGSVFLNRFFER